MKKSLIIVVVLLAISSMMAAMAFTSASVTSAASFSVVNSDEALLALIPSDDHDAAYLEDGSNAKRLEINWDKGYGNEEFGIQPYSTYVWEELFAVKNNSENDVHVKISLDPDNTSTTANLFFAQTRVASRWASIGGETLEFDLAPGEEEWINTKFESGSGMGMKAKTVEFNMIVEAEAAEAAEAPVVTP